MILKLKFAFFLMIALATGATAQKKGDKFIDVSQIDRSIHPGDDFDAYMNSKWVKSNPIPGTRASWGSFDMLQEKIQQQLKAIFKKLNTGTFEKGTDSYMLKMFYTTAMDSARANRLGVQPIKADLQTIDRIASLEDLQKYLAENHLLSLGTTAIFSEGGIADPIKNDEEIVYFNQGGNGLPEKSYYFSEDSSSKAIRAAYKTMLANMLKLSGETAAKAQLQADSILALETRLAAGSRTAEENRNIMRLLNYYTVEKMQKEFPALNWALFLQQMGATPKKIIVAQPEFFKGVSNELYATSMDTWKAYLKANLVVLAAPYLSQDFVTERFNFYNKTLSGQKEQKPRWERVVAWTDNALGEMLGKQYINMYFSAKAKQRVNELIDNLIAVYRERINGLEWMTTATKQKALLKLDSIRRKIAYPDVWTDYSGLTIGNDLYANIKATQIFNTKRAIARIGKPVNRTLWTMTPQTVNAYYNPLNNEIVFPAGILAFPFFDVNADDAFNYGGIGMVIGHEISHGFDDQGSQFDASGKFSNWWTKEDKKAFTQKGDLLAAQFDKYTVVDTLHVNGRLTLGENIGDLGGLTAAYNAFKKTKQYKEGKKIDGFTPEQRFFMSLAQIWRMNSTIEADRQQTLTNPHALGKFRILGPLSNFEPFYNAFGVTSKNKMWRDPADRIVIW